jgi:ribonuclease Z
MRTRSAAVLSTLLLLGAPNLGCERLIDAQIERNLTRAQTGLPDEPGLHVVLCGTGSPIADAARAAACTAVLAGGEFFLVDVGPGAWESVDLANLPLARLSGVLLTHFHSDHIGDLGEAMTGSWIAGRPRPLDVYGPAGTAQIVDGFVTAYAHDVTHRVTHHGDAAMPRAAAGAVAHEIPLDLADPGFPEAVVVERNGLRITMFPVDHSPVSPAVGYRFDYGGRFVVISGDTRKSASLEKHAAGADLLIHEALLPEAALRASQVAKRLGNERLAKLASDIPGYHTAPVEAAELAKAAGAKKLVLTHLVPGPNNFVTRRLFLRGVAEVYDGDVVLGEDGMRFDLEPGP